MFAAVCSADIKKYGFDPILRPFIEEIAELESVNGMKLQPNCSVHGTLSMIVADSLAAHQLLGFQIPSASYCCRMCYAQRSEINFKFKESEFILRSPISHDMLLQGTLPNYGVAKPSPFQSLKHFSVVQNYAFDPMHDLLEGVVGKELKLVLSHLVYHCKVATVANINNRISPFS